MTKNLLYMGRFFVTGHAIIHITMKKLLWAAFVIFTINICATIGYYWLFGGYLGNISLTVSRYVGLEPWSAATFLACNLAVIALLVFYTTSLQVKRLSWHLLVCTFAISFLALSLCPHRPTGDQIITIHRFFASVLFISLCCIATVTTSLTSNRLARLFCFIYMFYGFHFIIAYANHLPYLMDNILIWETLFIYGGYVLYLLPEAKSHN